MKRTKSSTKPAKVNLAPRISLLSSSISQETLEHMRQCEAREWILRRQRKIGEVGLDNALSWWAGVKRDIDKRRGVGASAELVKRMEIERAKRK